MTPERWERVKEVFAHASTLDGAAREDYLVGMCAQDAELRSEVDSLLAAHESDDSLLDHQAEQFAPSLESSEEADPWLGRRIGAYEIIACIGRGGMGAVYRARRADAQYEKEVAIKVVRAGFGTELVLQRFWAERQFLANLDHPNIARLLDGGATSSGEPFLVLELVRGEAIDEYCDRHNLPIAARLRLFREVCAAVSYAHRHLIVHRDLKPANILVTEEGSIKLLDFGIAKLLQPETDGSAPVEATRTLIKAMTPAFSSPEQVLGLPITTASDVYSLGVVLFHLLAGRGPYRSTLGSTRDAIRDVCEVEPLRPSGAAAEGAKSGKPRQLPDRDLDDITLRALRKEPDKRYSSVEQFSEDLRRYLAGLPVIARGDRWSYRAGKFWRRHHMALTMSGLVAIALLASLFGTIREARIAEAQRVLAAQHFASVRHLADTFIFQVHDAIRDLQGAAPARDLLMSTALSYLDTLAKQAGSDRGLQRELAEGYARLGNVQGEPSEQNTGQAQAAVASYTKALALFQALGPAGRTDATVLSEMGTTHLNRSRVLMMLSGDTAAAAQESQQAIALLSTVASMKPDDVSAQEALVVAYKRHAYHAGLAGDDDAAFEAYEKGVSIMEALYRRRPADLEVAFYLALSYRAQGHPRALTTPAGSALYLARLHKALQIDQRLRGTDNEHALMHVRAESADWNEIGIMSYLRRDFVSAADALRSAFALIEQTAIDTHNAQAQVEIARIGMNFGRTLIAVGQLDEAQKLLASNAALAEGILKHTDTLEIQYFLANCETQLGTIAAHRALAARTPGQQLQLWQSAHTWFEKSVPRFQPVVRMAKLDPWDRAPVDDAIAGLARSTLEIRRLQGAEGLTSNR